MIAIEEIREGKAEICADILDDLPQWFGIPESKAEYVAASDEYPMFAARTEGQVAGFVCLRRQTDFAAELFVLGVRKRFHRRGIGRALIEAAADFAIRDGFSFLTVKTLAPANPDPHYAATRRFYEAIGFLPLEVFPTLWDEHNPCLLMIKPLALSKTS
jgi:ribosomal protein S18 acetylase RimI-like enzyme